METLMQAPPLPDPSFRIQAQLLLDNGWNGVDQSEFQFTEKVVSWRGHSIRREDFLKVQQAALAILSQAQTTSHPPSDAKNNLTTKDHSQKIEGEQRNFLRLYDIGTQLIAHPLVQQRLHFLTQQYPQISDSMTFKITSPQDLIAANLWLERATQAEFIRQIRQNPRYQAYNCKLTDSDMKLLIDVPLLKAIGAISSQNEVTQLSETDLRIALQEKGVTAEDTQQILMILNAIKFRSSNDSILFRLTRTKVLNPAVLARMSNGTLTFNQARVLLASISIVKNNKTYPICNLGTGEINSQIIGMFSSSTPFNLILNQPNPDLSYDKVDSQFWAEFKKPPLSENLKQKQQEIAKKLRDFLKPYYQKVDPAFLKQFEEDLKKQIDKHPYDSSWHFWFFEIDGPSEQWSRELFDRIIRDPVTDEQFEHSLNAIHIYLRDNSELIHSELRPEHILTHETRLRQAEQVAEQELNNLFITFKPLVYQYLAYMATEFSIDHPVTLDIAWELDGFPCNESLICEKSGTVLRRIHFDSAAGQRADLTYFPGSTNPDSVFTRWQKIIQAHQLRDCDLAAHCLALYQTGTAKIPPDIKSLLAPLVLLLLGKEPAFDRASHAANYFLLHCVREGVLNFKEALKTMPMIAQGAISGKQFLLHTTDRPLDSYAHVQYKKSKDIKDSYFLSHQQCFSGRADDSIEMYDDVVTVLVTCCHQHLASLECLDHPTLNQLKTIFEQIEFIEDAISRCVYQLEKQTLPEPKKPKKPSEEDLLNLLLNQMSYTDNDDLVGEFALNYLLPLHPLSKSADREQ